MTDPLKLFCLVNGETISNAFPLSASSADDIGTIKKLIKSEKTPKFDDIEPDELILWHVSIPVTQDNKDVPILLESLTDKEELLPTKRVSAILSEGVSKDIVHIIVQRPPQASNTSPSLSSPSLQQSLPSTPLSGDLSERSSISEALQNMVDTVGGSFDENIGRVEVRLQSRVLAEQFYSVLEKARSVHELKINLDWEASYSDFKKLRDSLNKTSVAVLDFSCGHGPASDILNRKRRYDPIIQIMRHPSIQSFEIANVPKDFFRRASELTKDLDLSNLRHLGFTNFCYDHPFDDVEILMINTLVRGASHLSSLSLVTITDFFKGSKPWPKDLVFPDLKYLDVGLVLTDEDVNNLKSLVTRAPNLSLLSIDTAPERLPVVYISISDVITCTTDFKNKMRFSPPKNTSPYDLRIGPSQLFRDHGAQLESLNCKEVLLNESDMSILDEATQNGSSLKELYCTGWASDTSDETIKSLAKIIARSELHLLRTALWKDDVSACILQSIQWEHLRELETAEGEEELKAFSEEISKRVELGYLKHRTIPAEPVIKDTPETNPAIGTRTIKMRDTRDEGSVYAHYDYTITFTPGQLRPTVEEETTVISITSRS